MAEEVTRRGYRVSGETLNRWVRDDKEFPAIVERIVFDLFTIGHEEAAPPKWAERLARETALSVIEALAPADVQAAAAAVIARLEGTQQPDGEGPLDSDDGKDQDGLETPERAHG